MSMQASYIDEEDRLDLQFDGNLDVSVSRDICVVCRHAAAGLRACIIDLSNVDRIFDSGAAVLQMLYRKMLSLGATVVFLSDRPEIRKWIPVITGSNPRLVPVGNR